MNGLRRNSSNSCLYMAYTKKTVKLATIDGIAFAQVDLDLCRMTHICIPSDFCSGQNQIPKVLKIATNSPRAVVLSSKAGAHKSLISDRNLNHKVGSIY